MRPGFANKAWYRVRYLRWTAADYEAAVARHDAGANLHFRLGLARAQTEDWPEAAAAYEAALSRDDRNAAWHYCMGLARAKMED